MYRKKNSTSLFILILVLLISCDPLTSPKNEPPFLFNVFPPDGSSNVPTDVKITAGFSEKIDMSTLKKGFVMKSENSDEPLILKKAIDSESSDSIAMVPKKPLEHNTSYICELNENITDLEGKPLHNPVKWSFTTTEAIDTTIADTTAPKVISVTPEDGDTGITVDPNKINIQLEFNEPIIATDNSSFLLNHWDGGLPEDISIEVEINDNVATITPSDSLKYNTEYDVGVGPSLSDLNGNTYDKTKYWSFTTKKNPNLWRLPENFIATQVTTLNSDDKVYISAWKYKHQTWLGENSYGMKSFFLVMDKNGKIELKKEIGSSYGGDIDPKENRLENKVMSPKLNHLYFYNQFVGFYRINTKGEEIWRSGYINRKIKKDSEGNIYSLEKYFINKLDPGGNLLDKMKAGSYVIKDLGFFGDNIVTFGYYNNIATLGKAPKEMDGFFDGTIKFPKYSDGKIIDKDDVVYMISEKMDTLTLYEINEDSLLVKWNKSINLDNIVKKTQDTEGNLYFIQETNSQCKLIKISQDATKQYEINLGKRPEPNLVLWYLPQRIHNTIYIPWGREIFRFDAQNGRKLGRYND